MSDGPSAALAALAPDTAGGLWLRPEYAERGYPQASRTMWTIAPVADRLRTAAAALAAQGHALLILDAWRPIELQRTLFEEYRAALTNTSDEAGDALAARVAEFVTDPDRAEAPPAHATGGAVDVTLCDPATGAPRDLGGAFDELTSRSRSEYYADAHHEPDATFHALRALLHDALSNVGFVRLPSEWWHFEYGTRLWADARPSRVPLLTHPVAAPAAWAPLSAASPG